MTKYEITRRNVLLVADCLKEGITDTNKIAEELGISRRSAQRYVRMVKNLLEERK